MLYTWNSLDVTWRVKRNRVLIGYNCIKNSHHYALQGGIHNETSGRVNTRTYFITFLYPFQRIGRYSAWSDEGSLQQRISGHIKPHLRSGRRNNLATLLVQYFVTDDRAFSKMDNIAYQSRRGNRVLLEERDAV